MARGDERILFGAVAEQPAVDEVAERIARALPEIGRLDEVGEDVVAVVAQQRVAVDGERADGRDDHQVERDELHEARLGVPPDDRGDGCDHELDEHARGGDERFAAICWEAARRR